MRLPWGDSRRAAQNDYKASTQNQSHRTVQQHAEATPFASRPRHVVLLQEGRKPYRCHQLLHLPLQPGESGSITCVALPYSVLPQARGLRHQSSSWCTQLSWAQTTMPHPTPVRTSGVSLGSRLPTLHFPCYSSQVSRVHNEGLKRNGVGGVLLNAPSPLWGSPIFLQGRVRLTWSPITDHPMESSLVLTLYKRHFRLDRLTS